MKSTVDLQVAEEENFVYVYSIDARYSGFDDVSPYELQSNGAASCIVNKNPKLIETILRKMKPEAGINKTNLCMLGYSDLPSVEQKEGGSSSPSNRKAKSDRTGLELLFFLGQYLSNTSRSPLFIDNFLLNTFFENDREPGIRSKLFLVCVQMHLVAARYPNHIINFHFYEHQEWILKELNEYFEFNKELLPARCVLSLHSCDKDVEGVYGIKSGRRNKTNRTFDENIKKLLNEHHFSLKHSQSSMLEEEKKGGTLPSQVVMLAPRKRGSSAVILASVVVLLAITLAFSFSSSLWSTAGLGWLIAAPVITAFLIGCGVSVIYKEYRSFDQYDQPNYVEIKQSVDHVELEPAKQLSSRSLRSQTTAFCVPSESHSPQAQPFALNVAGSESEISFRIVVTIPSGAEYPWQATSVRASESGMFASRGRHLSLPHQVVDYEENEVQPPPLLLVPKTPMFPRSS